MMIDRDMMQLLNTLQAANLPVRSVVDDKPRYTHILSGEDQTVADGIMAEYDAIGLATINAIGMEVSATVGQDDTTATFTVLDSEDDIAFQSTVDVTDGNCSYTLATNIADVYRVRVYGTISMKSAYCEVVVSE